MCFHQRILVIIETKSTNLQYSGIKFINLEGYCDAQRLKAVIINNNKIMLVYLYCETKSLICVFFRYICKYILEKEMSNNN